MDEESFPEYNSLLHEQDEELDYDEQDESKEQVLTHHEDEQTEEEGEGKPISIRQLVPTLQPISDHRMIEDEKTATGQNPTPRYPSLSRKPILSQLPTIIHHPTVGTYELDARRVHYDEKLSSSKSIKLEFIRKVYSILTTQMLIIALIVVFLNLNSAWYVVYKYNYHASIVALIADIASWGILWCCHVSARKFPLNYIFLAVFTLTNGFLAGVAAIHHKLDTVIIAVTLTALVCFSIIVYSIQTHINFNSIGQVICAILLVSTVIFAIISVFHHERPVEIIVVGIGVLLFSLYLIYETHLMINDRHRFAFMPNDSAFAVLAIYSDIILIFLSILHIARSELTSDGSSDANSASYN